MTEKINITIPENLLEEVVKLAEQERRKRSNMITVLVEEALKMRKEGVNAGCYNKKSETLRLEEKEFSL